MLAFRRIVMARFPGTGLGGISRPCSVGGQSEHKEGRAWDWGVNASYASHRAIVKDMFAWLLAEDQYGNDAAMAKRFGIMYIIWNRRIWGSWGGWETYCVQKPRGCVDPDDKGLRHPHTDHVHFSMSREGAQKQTSFWNPERSMVTGMTSHPTYGYWELGANGAVASFGTGWYGSKSEDGYLQKPAAAIASTVTGSGYWIVTKGGRVFPFGDARNRGQIIGKQLTVVDIEPTPTGLGYWLLAKSGRVFPYGDAGDFGGAQISGETFAGMASSPSGSGYWLFATDGSIYLKGDAGDFGTLEGKAKSPVIGGDNFGTTGYWVVTAAGRVASFGDAPSLGSPKSVSSKIVDFATTPAGTGYWLMTEKGQLYSFGKAAALGSWGN